MRTLIRIPLERKTAVVDAPRRASDALTHSMTRFEFKAVETAKRQFEGLSSTWDLDLGGDLIEKGAYRRTLREWKASGRIIKLIDQHGYRSVRDAVGRLVDAKETDAGLETTFYVVKSADGDEMLARLNDKIIDGLSIGYQVRGWREPTKEEKNRGVYRVLTDVELREVSLVLWGMNEDALIDLESVKSIETALSGMKRGELTEDDKKTLRRIAARCGDLLRPTDPPSGDPPAPDDGKKTESPEPPKASPEPSADAPKAYDAQEELRQRLLAIKIDAAIQGARHSL